MRNDFRRAVRLAVWAVLAAALPAAAVEVVIPKIGMQSGAGITAPVAMSAAALSGVSAALTAPAIAPLAAPALSLSPSAAPLTAAPLAAAPVALAAPALAPAAALAPASIPLSASAVGAAPAAAAPELSGAPALDSLSAASHGSRRNEGGGRFFDGSRAARPADASVAGVRSSGQRGQGKSQQSAFIKNADGVWVGGRVAEQAVWINKMYAELSPIIDLADVMNVMDDAYDEARVKLGSVERAAADRHLAASSVHLEGTRNWVDAILTDKDDRNIAVHTHRVYFHPAPGNPASEIAEGIRRVNKYLDKAKEDFASGGIAEAALNKPFSVVELNFDTRGYKEIADHIRGKEAEFRAAYGDRYHFNYITEPKMESKALRAEYNRLVEKYMEQPEGLMGILDGVTYSREVGVGHELNSHKMRLARGLKITQAGRDFFGKKVLPDGRIVEEYKTEFDAVTEPVADQAKAPKDRDVTLWEDKSTRVWMTLEKTMEDTFLYKLRIYRENRAIIESSLGGAPLKVAFSVDVGGLNRRAAKQGVLVWKDLRQKELMDHLKASEASLSAEYGFPVSFIFVNSHPGESSNLFYQEPVEESDWQASQNGGGSGRKHKGNGRRR